MDQTLASTSLPSRQRLGEYAIVRTLAAERTYEALDAAGRAVVLKKLDEDCLLRGQLHSQIRDRLAAVRELAHGHVANLYSVERDDDLVFMVWEHLPAERIDTWATAEDRDQRQVLLLARELVIAVEELHALGIVHGQLHAGNVFVRDGRVRLTHVSPLLYTDEREDAVALVRLLRLILVQRNEAQTPLGALLEEAEREHFPIRRIAAALAVLIDPRGVKSTGHDDDHHELTPRGRSIAAAVIVALVGLLVAWAIWQWTVANQPALPVPPQQAATAD